MANAFPTPDLGELTDAGVVEPEFDASDETFAARWKRVEAYEPAYVLKLVREERDPDIARDGAAIALAQTLGTSRALIRRRGALTDALWSLLDASRFAALGEIDRALLLELARSTRPGRPSLHPLAALAALALRVHGDALLREQAGDLLATRALPDSPTWLYRLIKALGDDLSFALAAFTLEHRFWEIAALIGGLTLVARFAPPITGSPGAQLLSGCDRAAQQHYLDVARWLHLMADAARGGRLTHPWLERVVQAAIRASVDDAQREAELRAYHQLRRYDADHRRLNDLYEGHLKAYAGSDEQARRHAERHLARELTLTRAHHPARAQRLLELMLTHRRRSRVGSLTSRLRDALEHLAEADHLDDAERALIQLYVANYEIEPYAARLVRACADKIDWDSPQAPGRETLDMYLTVSDYERAFAHLTCKFDGITLTHADKDAALRVKTFVEKRVDPSNITRLMRALFAPISWVGSSIADVDLVEGAVDRALRLFERQVEQTDLRAQVLQEYIDAGCDLSAFNDIARLPADHIRRVVQRRRTSRMLVGALAGGVSGGLAPYSWSALTMADVPVLLGITADVCSRFCWYFGFDPRQHPELPMEILAVALGGSRPSAIEPMLLRHNLREFAVHKSLMVGALAHGTLTRVAGRALGSVMQAQAGDQAARRVTELARRAISRNLRLRAAESATSKTLPLVGAMLGASLNVALIYDVCEAAQAVLTDRFLERKYPEWIRNVGQASGTLLQPRDTGA